MTEQDFRHPNIPDIPPTMKAAVVHEPGPPEVLHVEERPVPGPRPGWSLVQVTGFGINHSEIFTRQGLSPTVRFPRILGIECVGVVARTDDPDRLPNGTVVVSLMGEMGREFDGGYAEYALLPDTQLHPVRTSMPWERLAAIPETYATAFGSMEALDVTAGDRVLVRGGSSSVGVAFLRLLKARWPHLPVTASIRPDHPGKRDALLALGYDEVIADRGNTLDIPPERRYTAALDLVGPAALRDTISHLADHGTVCSTGQLGGVWTLDDFDPIMELRHGRRLTGCYSGDVTDGAVQRMFDYIARYDVPTAPERTFSLDDIAQAHTWLEQATGYGKAVVLNDAARRHPMTDTQTAG